MKTILISGGAGYLGTVLSQELLKNYKVVIFDQLYFPWIFKNKKKFKLSKNLKFIKKNITDIEITDFNGIDIVCDLNGISNDPSSELNSSHTWDVNYKSRVKFAQLAKKAGVKRFIFNSTCSVYGFNKNKVYEDGKKNPLSTYAKANYKAENKIIKLKNNNFKVNALRNSTLFGFSNTMRLDLVINIFVFNLMRKKKIYIDGDGKQFRPFISVSDIVKIYIHIIKKNNLPSFICNLVSFNNTIADIATKISKILKVDKKLINFKNNLVDKRNYKVGSKKFTKYFGKNFKFANFSTEIKILEKNMKKFKIKKNDQTIRMKFYKKKLL
tara:strand:- start:18349 stop:19326 length:978 start_codon:yes stop_codon:yes gene_type:complete